MVGLLPWSYCGGTSSAATAGSVSSSAVVPPSSLRFFFSSFLAFFSSSLRRFSNEKLSFAIIFVLQPQSSLPLVRKGEHHPHRCVGWSGDTKTTLLRVGRNSVSLVLAQSRHQCCWVECSRLRYPHRSHTKSSVLTLPLPEQERGQVAPTTKPPARGILSLRWW